MPLIFYETHDGNLFEAEVPVGSTVMQGAVENMIDGIVAECGGNMTCGTCHCYVDDQWIEKTGIAEGIEATMVAAKTDPQPNSRLSCQIKVTKDMNGLLVRLPESQW